MSQPVQTNTLPRRLTAETKINIAFDAIGGRISDPYEIPQNPEITIDTSKVSIEDGMALLFEKLVEMGIVAK